MDNHRLHDALNHAIAAIAVAMETLGEVRESLPTRETTLKLNERPTPEYTPERYAQADAILARTQDELHTLEERLNADEISQQDYDAQAETLEAMVEHTCRFMTACSAAINSAPDEMNALAAASEARA